ncbi:hypothetical protein FACS1894206_03620 [Deltaproteobacteria bacterium]|nr:hypothetical protein FACS1894206_03620 [Deltaproteobacteria bacterium]
MINCGERLYLPELAKELNCSKSVVMRMAGALEGSRASPAEGSDAAPISRETSLNRAHQAG